MIRLAHATEVDCQTIKKPDGGSFFIPLLDEVV